MRFYPVSVPDVKTYPCFKAGFSLWWPLAAVVSVLFVGCAEKPSPEVFVRIASGPPYASSLEPVQLHVQPTQTNIYRVQPGDTLWAIAVAHTVDLEELAAWNGISNPDQLFVGQALQVRRTANLASTSTPSASPAAPPDSPLPVTPKVSVQAIGMGAVLDPPTKKGALKKRAEVLVSEAENWHELAASIPTPVPVKNAAASPSPPIPNPHSSKKDGLKISKNAWVIGASKPKKWLWPVEGGIIESFGTKGKRRNTGIDIAASHGAPVRATADGVVAYADDALASYGNLVLLRHGGSFMSAYAHNDKILVKRGELVRAGEIIARVGTSGRAESPRLHFELRKNLTPLNPMKYLPKRSRESKHSLAPK